MQSLSSCSAPPTYMVLSQRPPPHLVTPPPPARHLPTSAHTCPDNNNSSAYIIPSATPEPEPTEPRFGGSVVPGGSVGSVGSPFGSVGSASVPSVISDERISVFPLQLTASDRPLLHLTARSRHGYCQSREPMPVSAARLSCHSHSNVFSCVRIDHFGSRDVRQFHRRSPSGQSAVEPRHGTPSRNAPE
jgi:hypothetical protein